MNVYQETYTEEFINELPVDFNKIKNMNLTEIPEVFHDLFTTDWNWGRHSKMSFNLRIIMNDLHTEYVNWSIWNKYDKEKPVQQEVVIGFPKD